MTQPKNLSLKTQIATAELREKKLDVFAIVVISMFVITFAIAELTVISAIKGVFPIPKLLEFNGAALSMFGALWTALGVRMSPKEYSALLKLQKNSSVISGELIHTLRIASNFATFGAGCILVGGALLCGKIWFFSEIAH